MLWEWSVLLVCTSLKGGNVYYLFPLSRFLCPHFIGVVKKFCVSTDLLWHPTSSSGLGHTSLSDRVRSEYITTTIFGVPTPINIGILGDCVCIHLLGKQNNISVSLSFQGTAHNNTPGLESLPLASPQSKIVVIMTLWWLHLLPHPILGINHVDFIRCPPSPVQILEIWRCPFKMESLTTGWV